MQEWFACPQHEWRSGGAAATLIPNGGRETQPPRLPSSGMGVGKAYLKLSLVQVRGQTHRPAEQCNEEGRGIRTARANEHSAPREQKPKRPLDCH